MHGSEGTPGAAMHRGLPGRSSCTGASLSAHFAMVISPASTVSAGHGGGETPSAETAGLLAQAAAGPGFWEDLLGELRPAGLIAELPAGGGAAGAAAQAEHRRKRHPAQV